MDQQNDKTGIVNDQLIMDQSIRVDFPDSAIIDKRVKIEVKEKILNS